MHYTFFFLPIMLTIMPVNFARVYITVLIEQEMTILSFTRNDNIEFHKKQEMTIILSLHYITISYSFIVVL